MAIKRMISILIALGVFTAAVIFFAVLPTLEFQKDREELTAIADQYESTYQLNQTELSKYGRYAKLIDTGKTELQQLDTVFRNNRLLPDWKGNILTFTGNVDVKTFAEILSFFQNTYTLEITKLTASNLEKMPIQIREAKTSAIDILQMEIKMMQYNEKLLKR